MKRTIATPRGVKSLDVELTPEELVEYNNQQAKDSLSNVWAIWKLSMQDSDSSLMSRDLENVIDALDEETKGRIVQQTMNKYNEKKTLRGRKPLIKK